MNYVLSSCKSAPALPRIPQRRKINICEILSAILGQKFWVVRRALRPNKRTTTKTRRVMRSQTRRATLQMNPAFLFTQRDDPLFFLLLFPFYYCQSARIWCHFVAIFFFSSSLFSFCAIFSLKGNTSDVECATATATTAHKNTRHPQHRRPTHKIDKRKWRRRMARSFAALKS